MSNDGWKVNHGLPVPISSCTWVELINVRGAHLVKNPHDNEHQTDQKVVLFVVQL